MKQQRVILPGITTALDSGDFVLEVTEVVVAAAGMPVANITDPCDEPSSGCTTVDCQ